MKKLVVVCGVAAVTLTLAVSACRRPLQPATGVGTGPAASDSAAAARADSIARAEAMRRAAEAAEAEAARKSAEQDSLRAIEQRATAAAADAMTVITATVYFDYDQATLSDAAEAAEADAARKSAEQDSLRAIEQRATATAADAMTVITATVYFDYDQATLSDAARALLDAKVPALKANPSLRIRVTGHTDERGSSEYNLALGLRRAAETKAYLVAQGVDASRIEILSMGEEQPAVAGSGEEAWSRNRRAVFVPITGERD